MFCAPPSCHIVFNADVVSQPIDELMQAFSRVDKSAAGQSYNAFTV